MNRKYCRGFTLVELLVVITIIVLILALLAPALDQAIYQTELASCGARLKLIATAGLTYAGEQRRMYPPHLANRACTAYQFNDPRGSDDLRRTLKAHLTPAALLDPLCGKVSLDASGNRPTTYLFANFQIYMGWSFTGPDGGQGMRKIGDRFVWQGNSFNILAGDVDSRRNDMWVVTSHPDVDGALRFASRQDGDVPWGTGAAQGVPQTTQVTFSWWETGNGRGPSSRAPVDLNYAFDDASVQRYNRVIRWDDPRMVDVPDFGTGADWAVNRKVQLPPAN